MLLGPYPLEGHRTPFEHSLETRHYPFEGDYLLERADPAEFVRYWTVYRGIDEDFSPGLEERGADLREIPFAFWIRYQDHLAGGAVMLPNNIGEFFLVPAPSADGDGLLRALMLLLRSWSRPEKSIWACGITEEHPPAFVASGFGLNESRRRMIRPTAPFEPAWGALRPQALEDGQAAAIAQLLHRAFADSPGEYGRRDLEGFTTSVEKFFSKVRPGSNEWRASAVVRSDASEQLVAACLVNLHKGLPTIQFVATAPEHRGQGGAGEQPDPAGAGPTPVAPRLGHAGGDLRSPPPSGSTSNWVSREDRSSAI